MKDERAKLIIDLIKWVLGTLTLGLVTTFISCSHKEKELQLAQLEQERAFLDTFSRHAMSEDIVIRIRLAHYIQSATTDPRLNKKWDAYYNDLVKQCKDYYKQFQEEGDEEELQKLDREVRCRVGGVDKVVVKNEISTEAVSSATAPEEGYWPLAYKKSMEFLTGSRMFGSHRLQGRLHAGADLFAPPDTPVIATEDGTVLRGPYRFYGETYALEIKTDRGLVIRFGQLEKKVPDGIQVGVLVKAGEVIGYLGRLSSGMSALHFELFAGTSSGPLTVSANKYGRRIDIMNPSEYLSGLYNHGKLSNAAPQQ